MRLLRWLSAAASALVVASFVALVVAVLALGVPRFSRDFFTLPPEEGLASGGILPAIVGTLALVAMVGLITVPVGVLGGIYLAAFSDERSLTGRAMRWSVSRLAGLPAIVYGLFGLGFFVLGVGQQLDRWFSGSNLVYGQPAVVWAGLTMAAYTLPVVVSSTERALGEVPPNHRRAGRALGLGPWDAVRFGVLPLVGRGVLTGALVAVSRAVGEVAPIMFTGVAYFAPSLPLEPSDQFMELGYHVFVLATQSPDVEMTKPNLYATMAVLLLVTLALNGTVLWIRTRAGPGGRPRPRGTR
ncbi:ABC transporter permease subunit [Carboxydochorda subterranea]|uniref:ABC transporter permease subunit n=1 Tax=Carboxydichorda subterranea TaxID=3109565 RepID=A0ABZ1BXD9_9FIRM|nr:ABC transporter permease subunit [Limnochorda sp. L945t]WRP17206.1 ABC transporter permease subunit [Limnochorda sp. L945t]